MLHGYEDLGKELPRDVDLVFICSFTQAAFLAYAISNYFRSKGAVTVLGGRMPVAILMMPLSILIMCWVSHISQPLCRYWTIAHHRVL
jgi:hypothetical protein